MYTFTLDSVKELDLFKTLTSFFWPVPKSICRTITAREDSIQISSDQSMNRSALYLLYCFFLLQ